MLYAVIAACVALASANDEYSESDEPTICYGDDECRGNQVCDMGSYICVTPTPSPVTPAPTDEPGCCYNPDSYKGNDRCSQATDRERCEDMGCSFLVTDDPEDCVFTTTESVETTSTTEVGCCYGDSERENAMCRNKGTTQEACERGGGNCEFREGEDADCTFVPTTTTEEVGCCYGLESICGDRLDSKSCARRPEDCEWRVGEVGPCTIVKDTTTAEPGCCYNPDSYKGNDKCAAMSDDQERCEKQGCTFLVTDDPDDCVFTTTETPWLGEKDEAVLFGEQGTTLSEAMNTQISLSTLLLFAVVALAVQQLYKCYANSASRDGYTKLAEAQPNTAAYQMA